MKKRLLLVLGLAAGILLTPGWAQKKPKEDPTIRSVQGTVSDPGDNPVNGAVVQLKNAKTLQVRSFITQQDGTYHFHGLNTNVDYELRAEHRGMSSDVKTLSTFDSRRKAVINLKLETKK
jgi:hypothetical protein